MEPPTNANKLPDTNCLCFSFCHIFCVLVVEKQKLKKVKISKTPNFSYLNWQARNDIILSLLFILFSYNFFLVTGKKLFKCSHQRQIYNNGAGPWRQKTLETHDHHHQMHAMIIRDLGI
jgi:hypothetical protein